MRTDTATRLVPASAEAVYEACRDPDRGLRQSSPFPSRRGIELTQSPRISAGPAALGAPASDIMRKAKRMNPNKALWEKGDFTRIAGTMRESGEDLVASLGVGPGQEVLDLGCGDGTTALPAARAGADVLGVDIASNLVAAGRARAAAAGLANLRFEEGDASDLAGLPDDRFDLVLSIFGAMFAPRPFDVAREMVRVTRPGGRIVMGNWIPGDPTLVAQILRISAAFTPPPPEGFVSPVAWGVEDNVRERFAAAGVAPANIACERATWLFRHAGPPAEFLEMFRHYYGPTMNAFDAAAKDGREAELRAELAELFEAQNRAGAAGPKSPPPTSGSRSPKADRAGPAAARSPGQRGDDPDRRHGDDPEQQRNQKHPSHDMLLPRAGDLLFVIMRAVLVHRGHSL